jgi:RNA polymerase sigma-70 factor, ECF subfamily
MQPPPRSSEPADNGTKSGTDTRTPKLQRSDAARAKSRAHDEGLVQRAVAGDPQAFEELYERHRHAVYKVAHGMTRNVEDALDVVQETFVKAHKSLARFERRASIGTWLCQIAVHQAIDLGRRRKVRRAEPLEEKLVGGEGLSPRAEAQEQELRQALTKALDELSEKHRTVFVLYTVQGLSYKEIAEALGISIGTVMSRLFYARKNLQGLLAQFAR